MKKTHLQFGATGLPKIVSRRFPVHSFRSASYKTDGKGGKDDKGDEDPAVKKAREERKQAIELAKKEVKEFKVEKPEDMTVFFDLQRKAWELEGAETVKNFEEKVEVLEAKLEEVKSAKVEEFDKIKRDFEVQTEAFDKLQTRVKNDSRNIAKPETKTFNENLADTIDAYADQIREANRKGAPELKMEMKAVGDMNMAANFPGSTPWTQDVRLPIIESPYNRVWLADLLPQSTTKGTSIIYPKENGGEGGVAPWTDRTANKAQIDYDLTTQTAYVKWLAGWVIVDRDMIDDLDWFKAYLQSKMLISLKTAENDFILNGTTDTNPVQGLLDVATAYNGSLTIPVEKIIDAGWGQIVESTFDFYNPTTIVMTPRDAVKVGLNKAGGSGEYDLPAGTVAFSNGRLTIGGLTVAPTTQIGTGNFLVFDRNATQFVKKMQPELRMFEDVTLAKLNRVMFRIEERATLVVFNNDAVVSGELGAS